MNLLKLRKIFSRKKSQPDYSEWVRYWSLEGYRIGYNSCYRSAKKAFCNTCTDYGKIKGCIKDTDDIERGGGLVCSCPKFTKFVKNLNSIDSPLKVEED